MNELIKYPRTYHLPWSESVTNDDKVLKTTDIFVGKDVVITEKMDGENCTMSQSRVYARSIDSVNHPSRDWVKGMWSTINHQIPTGWRICGENLFARHSIEYNDLKSYFYGFSVWDENNNCLSWDQTLEWFELLDIVPVKVLYRGEYDIDIIKSLWKGEGEGYVVRLSGGYNYQQFSTSVGKFVRQGHVQNDSEHWLYGRMLIVPNSLI